MERNAGVIVLAVFACAGLWFSVSGAGKPPALSEGTQLEWTAYWEGRIRTIGPEKTVAEFKEPFEKLPYGWRHQAAHLLGLALYRVGGFSSLQYCSWDQLSGCVHEIAGLTLTESGPEAGALRLRDACAELLAGSAWLGQNCMHGAGHGLVTYFGYGAEELKESLAVCEEFGEYRLQCARGAFMEYSFRSMLSNYKDIRPMDGKPLAPCDEFSGALIEDCLAWQGTWWALLQGISSTSVASMGSYCRQYGFSDIWDTYICYADVGVAVGVYVGRSPERAEAACAPVSDKDLYRNICRAGAALYARMPGGLALTKDRTNLLCGGGLTAREPYCELSQ